MPYTKLATGLQPNVYISPIPRINKSAVAVRIINTSQYFLHIWFGSNRPDPLDPTATFHETICPLETALIRVTGAYNQEFRKILNYTDTGFSGDVNILPFYAAPIPSMAGTFDPVGVVSVTAYDQMEDVPIFSGIRPYDFPQAEQRHIAVPPATINAFTGQWNAADSTLLIKTFAKPVTAGTGSFNMVLYHYYSYFAPGNPAATNWSQNFNLSYRTETGGGAPVGALTPFYSGQVCFNTTNVTSTHSTFYPGPVVTGIVIACTPTVGRIGIYIVPFNAVGASQQIRYTCGLDVDDANFAATAQTGVAPLPIGGGEDPANPGTPGVVAFSKDTTTNVPRF